MTQTAISPTQVRVSIGTAIILGLAEGKMTVEPTTAYLMMYVADKCMSNCSFCSQARESKSSPQLLSRITWPNYPISQVLKALSNINRKRIGRICIQSINYFSAFDHIKMLVSEIKKIVSVPVSVSCQPKNSDIMMQLKVAGVDRLGIALDGATKAVFNQVKGEYYCWENQFRLFEQALTIFGRGNVSTHVIVGLGEKENEVVEIVQRCMDLGVWSALFAFTPVRGTDLEGNLPPKIESYRRIQLARYLIVHGKTTIKKMIFDGNGKILNFGLGTQNLESLIVNGEPFETSGCPDCNRPYYNEKASGPIYNYPKKPSAEQVKKIKEELGI